MVTTSGGSSGGDAPKGKKAPYRPGGSTVSDNALAGFAAKNSANEKKVGAWGAPGPLGQMIGVDNAMRSGVVGNIGQFLAKGQNAHYTDPMDAAKRAMAQYQGSSNSAVPAAAAAGLSAADKAGLAATSGHSGMDAARLQATGNSPYLDPGAVPDPGLTLGAQPTLNLPTMDYNGYLKQALGGLNLGALDKSYQDNINLIGTDTDRSVGNIGAAAQGAQQNIAGGTALLQQTGQQNNANGTALEAALSQQQAATAQGSGAANSSLAQTLGTGSAVGGNANSSLAAQNAAAQQYLAAAAQNNQAANDATTSAQVADNQNYGRVVDAKATSDQQNTQAAGRDAQSQVGLQRSQADLQARESASTQAASMQQNGMANALAQYQAQLGGWNSLAQYGQNQQAFGLQEAQFKAGQMQAGDQAIQQALQNQEGVGKTVLQYGGTNPEVSAQMMQDAYGAAQASPYLSQFGGASMFPLTPEMVKKYHLGGG